MADAVLPAADRPPISPNALVLLAAWVASGVALALLPQAAGPLTFAFVILGWIAAVVIHEFAHAFTAHKAGDPTIVEKGYLTLDPLKYADLGTSIVIPVIALVLGGIGFPGGAVYLREDMMRNRAWRSAASLAGPAGTFVVLLALVAAIGLLRGVLPAANPLVPALGFLAFLQATALVLNLLPVPGLDGYGVLRPWLPKGVRDRLAPLEAIAMLALLALLFFAPLATRLFFGLALAITDLLALPRELIQVGWDAFKFWS
ncbi:site-2 protease family protein [Phenylobacterium sp.]|uniref:site-2 protease family protein n=1 Tax=Phenylobacterium sp. TaxID=1871053 RepID=UPI002736B65C|nr:site-2 protease family protein [Phenylobacterium sp.]MDP3855144.1 site-2 protease family protein [Phenylobacterium sp.]